MRKIKWGGVSYQKEISKTDKNVAWWYIFPMKYEGKAKIETAKEEELLMNYTKWLVEKLGLKEENK